MKNWFSLDAKKHPKLIEISFCGLANFCVTQTTVD